MLHVISARCVAHDWTQLRPGPLERTCRGQFAAQWDCKNLELRLWMWLLLFYHYTLPSGHGGHPQHWTLQSKAWPPQWPGGKADLGLNPAFSTWGFFPGRQTCDLNTGVPVATLPGVWHKRFSAGTGWHGVSMLWLGEIASLTDLQVFSTYN